MKTKDSVIFLFAFLTIVMLILILYQIIYTADFVSDIIYEIKYRDLQAVELENTGWIRVPEQFEVVKQDGKTYLFKDGKPAIIQTTKAGDIYKRYYEDIYSGKYDITNKVALTNTRSDCYISTCNIVTDDEEFSGVYYIEFGYMSPSEFIVFDQTINYQTIIAICDSFRDLRYYGYTYDSKQEKWLKS